MQLSWSSLLNIVFVAGERAAEAECAVRQHERHQPGENSNWSILSTTQLVKSQLVRQVN